MLTTQVFALPIQLDASPSITVKVSLYEKSAGDQSPESAPMINICDSNCSKPSPITIWNSLPPASSRVVTGSAKDNPVAPN
jgi:hypothetical protein